MSTTIPWENEEEQNYICMGKIVNDVVSKGLRKVFKQEWNNRYQASFGAWDDTNVSGQQLFHLEQKRSRPNKSVYQAKFQHGDTNQWDCSALFDAILYSNSIGLASLSPAVKSEVNNLREIRNEIMHISEGKLSNNNFQTITTRVENAFMSLAMPINEINRIKFQKNRYKSFQALPPKPAHEVVYRSEKIKQISQDLEKLHSGNDGKLTYFYICGNPGSGKSQLARQVCEDIYKGINWQMETIFLMTLDGKDLDSLLYSYEDFCRRLNCNESVVENIINSSKPKDEKIKDLRSQITTRIKNWKRWWIIVDNVENLPNISPLLPQMGDEVWNNGQIILTTQNRTSIPQNSLFTKHISLSLGMNEQECRQLLALLSRTDAHDPLLDEVAEKLDRQPLAMAAAAVYMREVKEPNCCPDFSWQDYLGKLEKGKRKLTEERLLQVNSAYSSAMSTAVLLAVGKCAESNLILNHTFHLYSLISFEPLPLDLIVQYVQQHDRDLDAEDICLAINHCSLFLPTGNKDRDIRLHRVVHEAIKSFCHCRQSEIDNFIQSGTPELNVESIVHSVVKTLYYFKDREDKIKLIPHLKAFYTAIRKLFSGDGTLYLISSSFEKTELSEIYLFFGQTLRYYCDFELSMEFQNTNLQNLESKDEIHASDIFDELGLLHHDLGELKKAKYYHHLAADIRKERLGPNNVKVADSYRNLGKVYHGMGELEEAKHYHQQSLKIRKQQLGPNHFTVAGSYNSLGAVYYNTGDLKVAKDYFQRALQIQKEQLGPNHVDVGDSYNNLGIVGHDTGELGKAKNYHQRALEIRIEQLGPNHVKVATSYNNLGVVHRNAGESEKAKDYHQRAIKIFEKRLGSNHVKSAVSYKNLGLAYNDTGERGKAKDCHLRALEIRKERLGPNHVKVADSYNNLSTVCNETGEPKKAKDFHQRALDIRKEQLGPNHVKVPDSYYNLGAECHDTGDSLVESAALRQRWSPCIIL